VGVAFETLQTEYWVAGLNAFKEEFARRNVKMIQAIADGDANRQIEQVRSFITRKVDGIVLAPKDARSCLPIIKAANEANIPIVLFNRPAEKSGAKSVAVAADNVALTMATVATMIGVARQTGAVLGAVLIQSLENGLVIRNADPYLYPLIMSAIILGAVLLDSARNHWLGKLARRRIRVEPA
jgi:ABC-type xylose transport system substrate-binding protein